MNLQAIWRLWHGNRGIMSSEELRDVLFQNWAGIVNGATRIHDSIDFTVPDFIAADRSFMDVFNEVLHEQIQAEFVRRNVPPPNLSRVEIPADAKIESLLDWRHVSTESRPNPLVGPMGQIRRIGGGIAAAEQAMITEQQRRVNSRVSMDEMYEYLRRQNEEAVMRLMELTPELVLGVRTLPTESSGVEPQFEPHYMREYLGQWPDYAVDEVRSTSQRTITPPELPLEQWIEVEGWEIVTRKTTSKSKKAVAKDAEPVYVWGVQSSKPRGGQFITYEVRLEENGEIRCNCPSWIFKKAKAERGCKHSHSVEDEAKTFFQMFKRGEQLPTVAMTPEQTQRLLSNPKKTESDIGRFGRVLEID